MNDDEYWELRDRLTPGDGYHTVLSTILSRPDAAAGYDDIADRLEQDWDMDEQDTEQVLQELADEDMVRGTDDADTYAITDRAEAFLRKDMGNESFDRYVHGLRHGHRMQQKTERVKQDYGDTLDAAYDTARMEAAFNIIDPLEFIASVLAHPQKAPSLMEIDYMRPSEDRGDISEVMEHLEQTDAVDVLESEAYQMQGMPHRFYRATDGARAYLANETNYLGTNPAHTEAFWTDIYERTQKPDHIKRYERLPRPTGDT